MNNRPSLQLFDQCIKTSAQNISSAEFSNDCVYFVSHIFHQTFFGRTLRGHSFHEIPAQIRSGKVPHQSLMIFLFQGGTLALVSFCGILLNVIVMFVIIGQKVHLSNQVILLFNDFIYPRTRNRPVWAFGCRTGFCRT